MEVRGTFPQQLLEIFKEDHAQKQSEASFSEVALLIFFLVLEETIEFIRLLFFSYCTLYLFTVYCKGESSLNIVFIKMLQALSAKAIQPQLTTERQRKSS